MAFGGAAKKEQYRLRRVTPKKLGDFASESVEDEELIETLRGKLRMLDQQINNSRKGSPERRLMGRQKEMLAKQLQELRGFSAKDKAASFKELFYDIAREKLLPEVFKLIEAEASGRNQMQRRKA